MDALNNINNTNFAPTPGQPTQQRGSSRRIMIAAAVCVTLILISSLVWWFLNRNKKDETTSSSGGTTTTTIITAPPSIPQFPIVQQEEQGEQTQKDQKLSEIGMEYMLLPGHTPSMSVPVKLQPIPQGNPVYSMVSCQTKDDNTIAIRHQGKYLTVVTPSICRFESRRIGASCFKLVSGFCSTDKYVMFRHGNGKFLRAAMEDDEEDLYTLVCKDSPTTANFKLFCWKIDAPERLNMYSGKTCGCKIDASGVEVCQPCGDEEETEITLGPFPELMGFTVANARSVLNSKYPQLVVVDVACPGDQTCPSIKQPGSEVVTLFYNPEDGRINKVPTVQ